jgi:uncharacterized protein YecA (UPF0149 family)
MCECRNPSRREGALADKELVEKLGRRDPCPCGSRRRF